MANVAVSYCRDGLCRSRLWARWLLTHSQLQMVLMCSRAGAVLSGATGDVLLSAIRPRLEDVKFEGCAPVHIMNDAVHFPIPSELAYLRRRHRLPLSHCTGGVFVSTLIQTAKSCPILAINIHQNPDVSDLTRECNTMQRLIDSSNGKPLATLTWPKREWETIKALAAIVSGHRSFAEGRLRLRKYVQSRSLLASIRSTAGLSYLFLCYLGVKLLYLLNGVLPTRSAYASADDRHPDICSQLNEIALFV